MRSAHNWLPKAAQQRHAPAAWHMPAEQHAVQASCCRTAVLWLQQLAAGDMYGSCMQACPNMPTVVVSICLAAAGACVAHTIVCVIPQLMIFLAIAPGLPCARHAPSSWCWAECDSRPRTTDTSPQHQHVSSEVCHQAAVLQGGGGRPAATASRTATLQLCPRV